jgi:hypothetical protein
MQLGAFLRGGRVRFCKLQHPYTTFGSIHRAFSTKPPPNTNLPSPFPAFSPGSTAIDKFINHLNDTLEKHPLPSFFGYMVANYSIFGCWFVFWNFTAFTATPLAAGFALAGQLFVFPVVATT